LEKLLPKHLIQPGTQRLRHGSFSPKRRDQKKVPIHGDTSIISRGSFEDFVGLFTFFQQQKRGGQGQWQISEIVIAVPSNLAA